MVCGRDHRIIFKSLCVPSTGRCLAWRETCPSLWAPPVAPEKRVDVRSCPSLLGGSASVPLALRAKRSLANARRVPMCRGVQPTRHLLDSSCTRAALRGKGCWRWGRGSRRRQNRTHRWGGARPSAPGPGRPHSSHPFCALFARPGAEGLCKVRPVIPLSLLLEAGFLLKIRPGFGHTKKFGGDRRASESECDLFNAASSWRALWPG